ncbi:MAG: SDR family NAD(P)-dependent oxidoreductase [Acidobacteria bacterium]|nr:SDR family NAD(P)-dependent oxidoreductase [Acidobacteriota bacterium]
MKKVVLITGGSSGFGMLTAEKLLATGEWTVYASARRVERMKGLEEKGAKILKMDVTSDRQVQEGVRRIIKESGRIDALLANAGYGSYGTVESVPLEEIEYQYNVNIFGIARLLKAVLPQMRQQKSGRIVLVASIVSNISMAGLGWYASTKHALKAVANALRQEVKGLGIKVSMIQPGVVKTEFDEVALSTLRKIDHPEDYKPLMKGFDKYISDSYSKCPGPESTAKCMFKAITARRPKTVYRTTLDAKFLPRLVSLMPDKLFDRVILKSMK